jgi:molybdopterin synthase catalytic subunit
MFAIEDAPLDTRRLREAVVDPACGAVASFEGLVRNHHDGRAVSRLEYEAHPRLAPAEGLRVVRDALERFDIAHAVAAHRIGVLETGEVSVAVFVSAAHRAPAFEACRYIIDTLKREVPIWKREHFADGSIEWVGSCEGCRDAR